MNIYREHRVWCENHFSIWVKCGKSGVSATRKKIDSDKINCENRNFRMRYEQSPENVETFFVKFIFYPVRSERQKKVTEKVRVNGIRVEY